VAVEVQQGGRGFGPDAGQRSVGLCCLQGGQAGVQRLQLSAALGGESGGEAVGRCNLDNTGIAPEQYFTADPAALRPLLAAVDASAPLEWFAALGLYTRTDEAGRVYPYSNQANCGPALPPMAQMTASARRVWSWPSASSHRMV